MMSQRKLINVPRLDPLDATIWKQHIACFISHVLMFVLILAMILHAPSFKTYMLMNPLNGTSYTHDTMMYNAQGALSVVHVVTAISHAIQFVYHREYMAYVERTKTTPLRWIESCLPAPTMINVIGVLSGIRDRSTLICMAGLVFGVIMGGWQMQSHPKTALRTCAVAFIELTIAFAQIWVSFSQYDDAPDFVTAIIFTMTLLFFSFGFVPLYAMYFEKSIYFQEVVYNYLSLTSKTVLSALDIFGVRATA